MRDSTAACVWVRPALFGIIPARGSPRRETVLPVVGADGQEAVPAGEKEMLDQIIGKSKSHGLKLFSAGEIAWLEKRVFRRQSKSGGEFAVECFVRGKTIRLTPEEVVRQLYAHRLVEDYGYPASRLAFEFPVYFGRETKRADIVVRDKDDLNVPYIIVETKKPNGKDGREQLKSYTLATGATMAVWTNGVESGYHVAV